MGSDLKVTEIPIFWLNMDDDVVKRNNMETMFEKYGFTNHTRISATKDDNPIVGCALSHLDALENYAPESGFLILEDDCAVTEWFTTDDVELPDCDLVYFGGSIWAREPDETKRLDHHPYILSRSRMRSIQHAYDPNSEGNGPWLELHSGDGLFRKVTNMLSTHAIYYKTSKSKQETIKLMKKNLEANTIQHIDWLFADTLQKNLEACMFESPMFYQHIIVPNPEYDDENYDVVTKFRLSEYYHYVDEYFQWERREGERIKYGISRHMFDKHCD